LGIYGVAAAEAMALGRLVVSDVDQSVYDAVQARTGLTLPVCQTPAAKLERRIEDICRNPEPYRRLARSGPSFVTAVHSGQRSAAVLTKALFQRGNDGGKETGQPST
ncbi:MAG: hypothetical protein LBG11_00395, partial [Bifidobacteriaceae bacterium]|nr:hypothetical protein [Bifidobacteriaceae bacterium]